MAKKTKTCGTCGKTFRSSYVTKTCRPCLKAAIAPYWAESVSAAVLNDYRTGNVRVIYTEK